MKRAKVISDRHIFRLGIYVLSICSRGQCINLQQSILSGAPVCEWSLTNNYLAPLGKKWNPSLIVSSWHQRKSPSGHTNGWWFYTYAWLSPYGLFGIWHFPNVHDKPGVAKLLKYYWRKFYPVQIQMSYKYMYIIPLTINLYKMFIWNPYSQYMCTLYTASHDY